MNRAATGTPVSEYAEYLGLPHLLNLQRRYSEAHDESLFIVAHQVHELWFKQILTELREVQRTLPAGDGPAAGRLLERVLLIFRVLNNPANVLDSLSPQQFARFREKLGGASGFQSAQYREIEVRLGRRDTRAFSYFAAQGRERGRIEAAAARPSVFDALLTHLAGLGHPVPPELLTRDVREPLPESVPLRDLLRELYRQEGPEARLCERLFELDLAVQEWRYRHLALVGRLIGDRPGTGGTSGLGYLRRTMTQPVFPDLWAVRSGL